MKRTASAPTRVRATTTLAFALVIASTALSPAVRATTRPSGAADKVLLNLSWNRGPRWTPSLSFAFRRSFFNRALVPLIARLAGDKSRHVYDIFQATGDEPIFLPRNLDRLITSMHRRGLLPRQGPQAVEAGLTVAATAETLTRQALTRAARDRSRVRLDATNLGSLTALWVGTEPLSLPNTQRYRDGARVRTVPMPRSGDSSSKTMDRSRRNTLIRSLGKLLDPHVQEVFVLDKDDRLVEGTRSNVGVLIRERKGDREQVVLITPPTAGESGGDGALPGINMQVVMEIAKARGWQVRRERVDRKLLYDPGTEVFYTGTTPGIMPVSVVDGKKTGAGKPGALMRALSADFELQRVQETGYVTSGDTSR